MKVKYFNAMRKINKFLFLVAFIIAASVAYTAYKTFFKMDINIIESIDEEI